MKLPTRKFQARRENFICTHCGAETAGSGFTNHCPRCLWSKHVDVNPGDRAEGCGGMMEPIGIERKSAAIRIVHRCTACGYVRRNQIAEDDNPEAILDLSARSVS